MRVLELRTWRIRQLEIGIRRTSLLDQETRKTRTTEPELGTGRSSQLNLVW